MMQQDSPQYLDDIAYLGNAIGKDGISLFVHSGSKPYYFGCFMEGQLRFKSKGFKTGGERELGILELKQALERGGDCIKTRENGHGDWVLVATNSQGKEVAVSISQHSGQDALALWPHAISEAEVLAPTPAKEKRRKKPSEQTGFLDGEAYLGHKRMDSQPDFCIFKKEGSYYFALLDKHDAVLLRSKPFLSIGERNKGLQLVIKAMENPHQQRVNQAGAAFFLSLYAHDKQELARSCPLKDEHRAAWLLEPSHLASHEGPMPDEPRPSLSSLSHAMDWLNGHDKPKTNAPTKEELPRIIPDWVPPLVQWVGESRKPGNDLSQCDATLGHDATTKEELPRIIPDWVPPLVGFVQDNSDLPPLVPVKNDRGKSLGTGDVPLQNHQLDKTRRMEQDKNPSFSHEGAVTRTGTVSTKVVAVNTLEGYQEKKKYRDGGDKPIDGIGCSTCMRRILWMLLFLVVAVLLLNWMGTFDQAKDWWKAKTEQNDIGDSSKNDISPNDDGEDVRNMDRDSSQADTALEDAKDNNPFMNDDDAPEEGGREDMPFVNEGDATDEREEGNGIHPSAETTGTFQDMHSLYYTKGSFDAKPATDTVLSILSRMMQEDPALIARFKAVPDKPATTGDGIAGKRAQAAVQHLESKGIPASRLSWELYRGSGLPQVGTSQAEPHQRVDIQIIREGVLIWDTSEYIQ